MSNWKLSSYGRFDKSILVDGPLRLYIDYDDVDTDAVDEMIPEFLRALNENFKPPVRYTCPKYYDRDWETHESSNRYFFSKGTCAICGENLEEIILNES